MFTRTRPITLNSKLPHLSWTQNCIKSKRNESKKNYCRANKILNTYDEAAFDGVVVDEDDENDNNNNEKITTTERNSTSLTTTTTRMEIVSQSSRRSILLRTTATSLSSLLVSTLTSSQVSNNSSSFALASESGEQQQQQKTTTLIQNPQDLGDGFKRFYGEATSSSSYGGYGGSDNNFDKFKYFFDVPQTFEPDTVNKTEKSTNGTDARWVNPKKKSTEKAYCVTLPGYTRLKVDRMGIFEDLALSDYSLQDAIYTVDQDPIVSERNVGANGEDGTGGQLYVDYDLVGMDSFGHIFATITVYGGRLYSLFVWIPPGQDEEVGKRIRNSYRTIENMNKEQMEQDLLFYKRS